MSHSDRDNRTEDYEQAMTLKHFGHVRECHFRESRNYKSAVAWLDRITRQYPEISVTYMTNPAFEHT